VNEERTAKPYRHQSAGSGDSDPDRILLVTGGAGFIGSYFIRQAVTGRLARVVTLDKLTYAGSLESLASVRDDPLHTFIRGDVADRDLVAEVFHTCRPSAVVHLAAESHVDRSIDGPRAFLASNVVGTFTLLEAARDHWRRLPGPERDVFRVLVVSTDEVFGSLGPEGWFTESSPCAPSSPYAASKAAADHFARAFQRTYGLPVLLTRCSNNYGPYQHPEKLIPLMALKALRGEPLPVYGDGGHVRDWLFVGDHCRALWAVLNRGRPGESYNLGGGAERTNLQVIHAVCAAVDRLRPGLAHAPSASLIQAVEDRPGHDRRYAVDAWKARAELGWSPAVRFEEGLEQTVAWYLSHPEWVESMTRGGYAGERLGLGRQAG
jgi:dTDP-glucose 4,6-dehydratase